MTNPYSGGNFDDFLAEEGILAEVSARALKRLSKSQLAESMQTSRTQVDRLLDPNNTTITLASLDRLARAVGKQLRIELA
jgi:plasmid maintenance system antidote protein VapI